MVHGRVARAAYTKIVLPRLLFGSPLFPPKPDNHRHDGDVRFVPTPESCILNLHY
jgi:hypothetical protein